MDGIAPAIHVFLFGSLCIQYGDVRLDESSGLTRKAQRLLAYLVTNRDHAVPQDELGKLWEESDSVNPAGAVKTLVFRTRNALDALYEGAGRDLLLAHAGTLRWNPEIPVWTDCEEFSDLCVRAETEPDTDTRLSLYNQAMKLYFRGEFLSRHSDCPWVTDRTLALKKQYSRAVRQALLQMEASDRHSEAVQLCRHGLQANPYSEGFCAHLMKNLLALGDNPGSVAAYESFSERLFSDHGILPGEELRELYRQCFATVTEQAVSAAEIMDSLEETSTPLDR